MLWRLPWVKENIFVECQINNRKKVNLEKYKTISKNSFFCVCFSFYLFVCFQDVESQRTEC